MVDPDSIRSTGSVPRPSGLERSSVAMRLEASRRRNRLIGLSVLLLGLIVIQGMARGWWLADRGTIPPELVGIWVSTAASYERRRLEVLPGSVSFHSGEAAPVSYQVRSVKRRRQGLLDEYRIRGTTADGAETELSLEFHPDARFIAFRNAPGVPWRRREGR